MMRSRWGASPSKGYSPPPPFTRFSQKFCKPLQETIEGYLCYDFRDDLKDCVGIFTFLYFVLQDLITNLTKSKNKMTSVSRRLSSSAAQDKNLRQQISDLNSLMKGVVKLVLTRQQELRSALEKMVKVETALLHQRDFEGKLQEWSQLLDDVEEFVKHLGPFNKDEKDLELLYFEVRFHTSGRKQTRDTPDNNKLLY